MKRFLIPSCVVATILLILYLFAAILSAQDVLPVYGTVKTWPESQSRWLPRRVTTYSLAEVDVLLAATSYAEAVRLNPRAADVGALWANYEAQRAKYQKTKPGGDTPPVATPAPLVGPTGPPGATGPAGPQGEPGSVDPAFLDELDTTLSEMAGISTTLAERLVAVEARLRALETSTPPVVPPPVDPPPPPPPAPEPDPQPTLPPLVQELLVLGDGPKPNQASVDVAGHTQLPIAEIWNGRMASIAYGQSSMGFNLFDATCSAAMQVEASLDGGPWVATRYGQFVLPLLCPTPVQVRLVGWPSRGKSYVMEPMVLELDPVHGWVRSEMVVR